MQRKFFLGWTVYFFEDPERRDARLGQTRTDVDEIWKFLEAQCTNAFLACVFHVSHTI